MDASEKQKVGVRDTRIVGGVGISLGVIGFIVGICIMGSGPQDAPKLDGAILDLPSVANTLGGACVAAGFLACAVIGGLAYSRGSGFVFKGSKQWADRLALVFMVLALVCPVLAIARGFSFSSGDSVTTISSESMDQEAGPFLWQMFEWHPLGGNWPANGFHRFHLMDFLSPTVFSLMTVMVMLWAHFWTLSRAQAEAAEPAKG